MTPTDKRAALFEYFKEGGGDKGPLSWRKDGARLYDALQKMSDGAIDQFHKRMLELKNREKTFKETVVYKPWKSDLFFFLFNVGMGLFFFNFGKPDYGFACFNFFLAGAYFEDLMNSSIHNYVTRKYNKADSKNG